MTTRSTYYRPCKKENITNTPKRVFGVNPERNSLYVHNPAGSGAILEVQFDDTAYGEGLPVYEGQTWYPEGESPRNGVWLSSDVAVDVRLGEITVWKG